MKSNQTRRNPLPILLLAAVALFLLIRLMGGSSYSNISYAGVLELFETEQVEAFALTADGVLELHLRDQAPDAAPTLVQIGDTARFHADLDKLIARQHEAGIITDYDYLPADDSLSFSDLVPYLLAGVCLGLLVLVIIRTTGGQKGMNNFTRANTRNGSSSKVTFADVAGAEEEKQELQEVVEFLREPQKFTRVGARIPKGILLEGPPGTGKTLLARAVAGEAGVQFLSISGSEFLELYVGVGASRVRDLFDQAKKMAPAIVFIDEIDAVGRRRGAGLGGGHDEREQTLNQLLVEMDGFGKNEGVVVLAATNRKDILDPALLRPGRFDRIVYVGRPDWKGREAILKVHTREKPLAEDVDLGKLARATAGVTGADLENLVNEAALLAARENCPVVADRHLQDAMMKVLAGPAKRSRMVSEHERKLTAIHEAGHAVSMHHLPTHDPVHHVTIIPRGAAGGMTVYLPEDDRSYASRNEMFEQIVSLLGGRVAEQLFLDDISTGASNDLQRATAIARDMVSRYGMSDRLGPVAFDSDTEIFVGRDYEKTKAYSEQTAGIMDEEIKAVIDRAYSRCTEILQANRDKVEAVSAYLLEHEDMNRETFEGIMGA